MRWLAALLLVLWAGSAAATQDRWPALYDVTGVAASDVLNIREAPEASAAIIGSLAPDAKGVELVRPNDRETWALVNTREGSGWVSLRFLARQPGQWVGSVPERALCTGTEPFWSLEIAGGALTYATPEDEGAPARIDSVEESRNIRGRHLLAATIARSGGPAVDLLALLSNEACSDGMSDRAYGYRLDLVLRGQDGTTLQSGCCALAR
jgi:uncharacterized membrane protein